MDQVHIRALKKSDHSQLADLYLVCREKTFYWMPSGHFRRDDFFHDIQGERCFVAEHEGRVIGFISVWLADSFIHHLYVGPDHQGRGVGKRLLQNVLVHLDSPARLKCIVRNEAACLFYESLGWKKESVGYDSPVGPYNNYRLDFI